MRVYSFANTVLLINGVEITGWADGDDVIDIKRLADSASHKVGAAGEMMVALSADKSAEVGIKLQQTSSSNKYLNDIIKRQESGVASRFVPVQVLFQDCYRQDIGSASVGYLKKPADMTRGASGNNQQWTIVVERLDLEFGDAPDVVPA